MSVMSLAIFSSTVHVLLICQHRSFQITPTIFRRSIEQSFKKLSFLSCSSSTVYISSRMDWSKPLYSTVQCAACWMDLGRLPWLKGLRNTGLSAVCVCVLQLAVQGSFSLSQLCIRRGNMEFLKSVASESVTVSVEGTDFAVDVTPVDRKWRSAWLAMQCKHDIWRLSLPSFYGCYTGQPALCQPAPPVKNWRILLE